MAAPWRLERVLQSPITRINGAPRVKANSILNTEGSSVVLDDLLLKHRPAHRTLAGKSVLAFVLAALALTYLLVTCTRHLSKGFAVSSQQSRLLASNFPYEDEEDCQAPSSDGEQETWAENAEGFAPEGAAAAALPEDFGAHGPVSAAPAGQTRRRLPGSVHNRVGRTLLLLEQPVAVLTPLIPVLRPDHCLAIARILCKIAALELSAFSTVPPSLQPLRQRVAQLYVDLIEEVLTKEPTAGEAVRLEWNHNLRYMQILLQRLAQVPPESEKLSAQHYRLTMENQRRACHWTISQVLSVLQAIKRIKTKNPTSSSNEAVFQRGRILNSLFIARRHQILRCVTLRYWLEQHHRSLGAFLVYGFTALNQARQAPMNKLTDRLNEIASAVIQAGGRGPTGFARLPPLPEEHKHPQQQQPLLQHFDHHQQPGPSDPYLPQGYEPDPIHVTTTAAQHPHPHVQPLAQAQYMPQPPQPAQVAVQEPMPFDLAAQDLHFPAINPDPQVGGQYQPPIPVPHIRLPPVYYYAHLSVPPLDEPPTSPSTSAESEEEFDDFFAHI
ncbi:hypothetical protein Emag_005245 [Eimeria magna]